MSSVALITGITGQDGSYLAEFLLEKNYNVWGSGVDEVGYDSITGRDLIFISEKYYRLSEVDHLIGDATKAKTLLGWEPEHSFEELVKIMVNNDCQ
jgi:GDP-D-mannose dehydratase